MTKLAKYRENGTIINYIKKQAACGRLPAFNYLISMFSYRPKL